MMFTTGFYLKHILKESKNKNDNKQNFKNIKVVFFNLEYPISFINYSASGLNLPYLRSLKTQIANLLTVVLLNVS